MKKIILIICIGFCFIFSNFAYWDIPPDSFRDLWNNQNTETDSWDSEWVVVEETSYIYYYWNWCSHCATLDKYLESTDAYKKLWIVKKEVWNNEENNKEMLESWSRLWVNLSKAWVPSFLVKTWDTEICLVWDKDIMDYLSSKLWDKNDNEINSVGYESDWQKINIWIILLAGTIIIIVLVVGLKNKK